MKFLNKVLIITIFCGILMACNDSNNVPEPDEIPEVPANIETPDFQNVYISSDKACYAPGEQVSFSLSAGTMPSSLKVRYKYLNEVVSEMNINSNSWTWNTPSEDFKGYMAEVYMEENGTETIYATIGIDVSSEWTKFPRYGFLSDYSQLEEGDIEEVMEGLNRHHINGIQFYDWHNKHHKPLPFNDGNPASSWKDIINKEVYLSTVKSYISTAHRYNMKTMYYNLIYGAWGDAQEDGVDKQWYVYKDNTHSNKDFHPLSSPFLSNLYVLDPSNTLWQDYYSLENNLVYQHLDFDGFHMDQLGDRGIVYDYDGIQLNLSQSFEPFINAMKSGAQEKYNVMNAVNQYGQQGIASAATDFLYTEVWSPNDSYNDLSGIIRQNDVYTGGEKNTVLAAYVNYDLASQQGYFNTPSVLMTDAVIFAFGGAHLELGEHMLGKEYFPNNNLSMKEDLKTSLIAYYDFQVAYQNLLRDGGTFNAVSLQSLDGKLIFSNWPADIGEVGVIAKRLENRQIISLINFLDATTTNWRDNSGIQASPGQIENAHIVLKSSDQVKNIWIASPDIAGGASRIINFAQEGENVSFSLPELKYWTMIVVEY
ncbi:glycoside hydrolase family 66 protein [Plebeiibacterium marinum]|uniref:Glycoside hydrolase family 66 protein n=1 Tax=Plebeiibacterium marinum TaxID=2992111 RepID=A0AAE3SLD9_9BACT|nr:glycoside hydrolase family 66 protein [Plebeiobacterium marinum]MCW3807503.1 glycoside hydrolase family 66 protein [Plebeiobacterium marinum]